VTDSIFGPAERRADRPPGAFPPEAIWGPVKHAPGSAPSSEHLADIWGPPPARALPPPPAEVAAELWPPAEPPPREPADELLWDEAPDEGSKAGGKPDVPHPRPSMLHRLPRSLEGAWAAGPSKGGWFDRRARARRD
jgi:hypothetical protein